MEELANSIRKIFIEVLKEKVQLVIKDKREAKREL